MPWRRFELMEDDDAAPDNAAALAREALISQPRLTKLSDALGGAMFPVHVIVGSFPPPEAGRLLLIEQRTWMAGLAFGDLVKRRKKEKKEGMHAKLLTLWNLSPEHLSLPGVHASDTMKALTMSFPLLLSWLAEKAERYTKAHGASGSRPKLDRILNCISDLFNAAARGIDGCGSAAAPSLHVAGVDIPMTSNFEMDTTPMLPAFPALEAEWNMIFDIGGLAPSSAFPVSGVVPAVDAFKFLVRRCMALNDPRPGEPLCDLRNGICFIAGSMAERAAAQALESYSRRKAHQCAVVPILGKTGQRRARRSGMDVLHALEVADGAGHSEAIIWSTGSN